MPHLLKCFLAGTASLAFMYMAPISASQDEDMTVRMICHNVSTEPLFGGIYLLLDMKNIRLPYFLLSALINMMHHCE